MSICLSITCWYSVETVQRIIKLFSLSGWHTTLVFAAPNVIAISNGDPIMAALNAGKYEKIAIYNQYLAISQK